MTNDEPGWAPLLRCVTSRMKPLSSEWKSANSGGGRATENAARSARCRLIYTDFMTIRRVTQRITVMQSANGGWTSFDADNTTIIWTKLPLPTTASCWMGPQRYRDPWSRLLAQHPAQRWPLVRLWVHRTKNRRQIIQFTEWLLKQGKSVKNQHTKRHDLSEKNMALIAASSSGLRR